MRKDQMWRFLKGFGYTVLCGPQGLICLSRRRRWFGVVLD